jgi:hypothetical protein
MKGELIWVEILDSEILCALMMMIIHSYKKTEMVWIENLNLLIFIHRIHYIIISFKALFVLGINFFEHNLLY